MKKYRFPLFQNRILLSILLPVLIVGLIISTLSISFLTPPLLSFIQGHTDSDLRLASTIGFTVCENHLIYLLDLRLENNPEMNASLKKEAIEEIKGISKKFHKINMLIIEDNRTVLGSSLDLQKDKFTFPNLQKGGSDITTQDLWGDPVKIDSQYFPFWNWHIVSFISEKDYMSPILSAKKIVYLGTFGVLTFVLATLFFVFNFLVNLPLKRVIRATEGVAEGKFSKVDIGRKDEIGQLVLSFNSMIENLNKKNAEVTNLIKALKKSDERQKTIMDSVQTGIITIEPETHTIVDVNPAATKMIGEPKEKIIGHMCHKYICPAEKGKCPITDLGQKLDGSERFLLKANGEKIPILKNVVPIMLGGKEYLLESFVDLTEKQKLEAQLQRAQKMEAIGTLAGGVAHDLNNVLGAQVSYPDLILMDLPEDSPLRKPILTIQESGQRAAAIVQDLLTLARRGIVATEVTNLNQIVDSYLKSPEYENLKEFHPGVKIEIDLETYLLNIMGSPVHLSKTVMNLVINAAEAMPDGGNIFITTQSKYIDKPIRGYDDVKEGDYVILTVSDSGIGILSGDLDRIFEPFYTKKIMGRSGTGLGMAVIWGTVKDHKGYIDVQSNEGKGTTFTLYFPVTRKEIIGKEKALPMEEYMGKGEAILVVDDVKEQREIAARILTKLGYSVTSVSSGEEAVDYIKDNSADLLILDMIMDPGIDGLETYKRILELQPGHKAIIASGFSETDRVKEAQRLGAGKYIKKPYTLEKIGLAIKEELEKLITINRL